MKPELRYLADLIANHWGQALPAVPEALDWAELVRLIQRHRLVGHVVEPLRRSAQGHWPTGVEVCVQELSRHNALSTLKLSSELSKIAQQLNAAKIPWRALKGPALAKRLYGNVARRPSGDLDILVPLESLAAAKAVLTQLGYQEDDECAGLSAAQLQVWRRSLCNHDVLIRPDGLTIELHWFLFAPPELLPISDAELWATASHVQLNALEIPLLAAEHDLLFLCTHGAKHYWAALFWLIDIVYAYRQLNDWPAFWLLCQHLGAERPVAQALLLVQQVWDLPVPEEVLHWLAQDADTAVLVQRAVDELYADQIGPEVDPDPSQAMGIGLKLKRLAYLKRLRNEPEYHRQLQMHLRFSINDWRLLPLPGPLMWLYMPLRPLLWLIRRLRGNPN